MSKKNTHHQPKAVLNRRARYDYALDKELVTGIVLTGPEVRAARDGRVHLKGAFVTTKDDGLWLNNASFSVKLNERGDANATTVDTRARKLLAHKDQIASLTLARKKDGMTIVPVRLSTAGKYIKLVIALGKGKKTYDKRETIKRRDIERDHARMRKSY